MSTPWITSKDNSTKLSSLHFKKEKSEVLIGFFTETESPKLRISGGDKGGDSVQMSDKRHGISGFNRQLAKVSTIQEFRKTLKIWTNM
jgi:hypothetical protein